MPRWRGAGALLLLLLPTLSACARNPDAEGIQEGEASALPGRPQRILSLVPSATQTLQALGAGQLLVGRTDYDTASVLAHLPSVGGGLQPSLEAVVALDPDLVIRFAGDSDQATSRRLTQLEIPQLEVRPDRMADVRETILELGVITGHQGKAADLVARMDSTLLEIESRLRGRTPRKVAYLLGGNPPWAAGGGTFVEEVIGVAGGINVFHDLKSLYGPVSPEELMAREIDLILVPEGSEVQLPGMDRPVRLVPSSIEVPGPYLAREAWRLAEILHPEAFR
jgi:iron complex transport system substrate-binding protein